MDTTPPPPQTTVDVTGLPPQYVQLIEAHVAALRELAANPPPEPRPMTVEQLDRMIDAFAAESAKLPPTKSLPADFSRADIYPDD